MRCTWIGLFIATDYASEHHDVTILELLKHNEKKIGLENADE